MMQQHMCTQDFNFEASASYVTEALVSLRTDMNANHEVILPKINHIISAHEDDSHLYESFYREICELIDSQYRNEGHGWKIDAPRGRGRRQIGV